MVTYTKFRDVKLRLNPKQWSQFTVPYGIGIIWDDYNFEEQTVVGRFYCSQAHENESQRKTEEELVRFLESLGRYVITTNAVHSKLRKAENSGVVWGQRTISYIDHPYLKDVPKEIDVHPVDLSGKPKSPYETFERHYDAKKVIDKDELDEVNRTIQHNAGIFREWKPFRDERFRPREVYDSSGRRKFEVYTAILEEID